MTNDQLAVTDAPAIPDLTFRRFRGPSDYPAMVAAVLASAEADKVERADTVEDVANSYAHLSNSDPYQDMIFAEVNGEVAGYARGYWWEETNGPRICGQAQHGLPQAAVRYTSEASVRVHLVARHKEQPVNFPALLAFLSNLAANNNKAWFEENRATYQHLRAEWIDFVQEAIDGIAQFDPTVAAESAGEDEG